MTTKKATKKRSRKVKAVAVGGSQKAARDAMTPEKERDDSHRSNVSGQSEQIVSDDTNVEQMRTKRDALTAAINSLTAAPASRDREPHFHQWIPPQPVKVK